MKNKRLTKYYLLAGEASGDLHGGNLIRAIKKVDSRSSFFGIGGKSMINEGLCSLVSLNQIAVLGFFEVIKKLPFFLQLKKNVIEDINKVLPDKIILIDYPGFNLRLAKEIKRELNIPVIYYISPQLWAWKENRIEIIKQYIDEMIVLFPFEKEWYKKKQINVKYFGHPLIELYNNFNKKESYIKNNSTFTVALLPGSRRQEIKKHLPVFKKTIKRLKKNIENIHFILQVAPGIKINIKKHLELSDDEISIAKNESFSAFHQSDFAIVASGTATLEGAISQTPMVVVYKTSFFSWFLARCFLRIPYVSIVNIINKSELVKEFLQFQATSKKIAESVESFYKKETVSPDYSKIITFFVRS